MATAEDKLTGICGWKMYRPCSICIVKTRRDPPSHSASPRFDANPPNAALSFCLAFTEKFLWCLHVYSPFLLSDQHRFPIKNGVRIHFSRIVPRDSSRFSWSLWQRYCVSARSFMRFFYVRLCDLNDPRRWYIFGGFSLSLFFQSEFPYGTPWILRDSSVFFQLSRRQWTCRIMQQ